MVEGQAYLTEVQCLASRWRRVGALFIDLVIMSLPLVGAGFVFFDQAAAAGEWGRLVGLIIFAAYFAYFNSHVGGGQSPGKRLLKIKVRHIDGSILSPAQAGIRALILGTPLQLGGLSLGLGEPLIAAGLYSFLGGGLFAAQVYLFFFNKSRRLLHDLISGTVVTGEGAYPVPSLGALWPGHVAIVIVLLTASIVLPIFPAQDTKNSELKQIATAIEAIPDIRAAGLWSGNVTQYSTKQGTQAYKLIRVTANLRRAPGDQDPIFLAIEDILFSEHSALVGDARVQMILRYGFTCGAVCFVSKNFIKATSAAEWKKNKT
jgi:uncharacterized RDD family membrane protein YckC